MHFSTFVFWRTLWYLRYYLIRERRWYEDNHEAKFLPLKFQSDMRRLFRWFMLLPLTIPRAIKQRILDIYSGAYKKYWLEENKHWLRDVHELRFAIKYDFRFIKKVIALVYFNIEVPMVDKKKEEDKVEVKEEEKKNEREEDDGLEKKNEKESDEILEVKKEK